jgi:hypothetical protein
LAVLAEYHEVDDIDDTDSYPFRAEGSGRSDDFVRHLDSDTDEDDIGFHPIVCRVLPPHRSPSNAVAFRLLGVQPDSGGVL